MKRYLCWLAVLGVAAGLEEAELKFKRHIVDPRPALARLEV